MHHDEFLCCMQDASIIHCRQDSHLSRIHGQGVVSSRMECWNLAQSWYCWIKISIVWPNGVLACICCRRIRTCWASISDQRLHRPTPPACRGVNTMVCRRFLWKPILLRIMLVERWWTFLKNLSGSQWGNNITRYGCRNTFVRMYWDDLSIYGCVSQMAIS